MLRFLRPWLPVLVLGLYASPTLAQSAPMAPEHHHHSTLPAPGAQPGSAPMPPQHTDHHMNMGHTGHDMEHSSPSGHDLGPADETYDLRFIDAMVQHHTGALLMSELVIGRGYPGVGDLANTIIRDQNQEIGWMLTWRRQWYPQAPAAPLRYTPGQSTALAQLTPMSEADKRAMQMIDDLDTTRPDRGSEFVRAMIHHHEMALAMAEDALSKSQNPSILWIARQIFFNQREELRILRQMAAV